MDSGRAQHVSGNDSPAAIRDVLFDFAGVLVDWRPWLAFGYDSQEALDEAVGEGKPGAAAVQRFFDRDDPEGFWALDDLRDAGMPNAEVCARYDMEHSDVSQMGIAAAHSDVSQIGAAAAHSGLPKMVAAAEHGSLPLRGMYRRYFDAFAATVPAMMPGMAALLADLAQQGIGVWGLTNWSDEDVAVPLGLPGMEALRGVIVSGREKLVKPDEAIYRLAVARFGLTVGTTAFFDDKPVNVAGAQAVGIRAHVFAGAQDARDFLRTGGIGV